MENKKKHIDDLFREKLGSYSEVPPADVWADLDKKLDTLTPAAVPTSSFRWLGHVAMVSVIAVLGVSLVQKFTDKSDKNNAVVKQQDINKLETSDESVAVNNETASASETEVPAMDAIASEGDDNVSATQQPVSQFTGVTEDNNQGHHPASGSSRSGGSNNAHPSHSNTYHSSTNTSKGGAASLNSEEAGEETNNTIGAEQSGKTQNNTEDLQLNKEIKSNSEPAKKTSEPLAINKNLPKTALPKDTKKKVMPLDFARWSAGIKGGYERGFENVAATKYVIAPYMQYNISKKVAIMVQPAAKFAKSAWHNIGPSQSYYQVNNDGKVVNNGNFSSIKVEGSSIDTYYHSRLRYTQSHDSIVKTNRAGGSYMEYELPVMVKYNLNEKVAVYGGVNMIYSQMKGVTEQTYKQSGIVTVVDTIVSAKSAMPAAPAVNEIITYNGTPVSEYNGPLYPFTRVNQIRFGATVGVSYEYSKRWLVDALVQQNPAPRDVKGGYNINTPLSATYFRISVGYKLTK